MGNQPLRILLVEDSRLQREILRGAFVRMGYAVDAVETGEEALACYHPGQYDVLFVDMVLPGISGGEVLAEVRQLDLDQCIILMTAEGSGLSAVGAIRAGADDYVTKPIQLSDGGAELDILISRTVERRRLAEENRILQEKLVEAQRLNAVIALAGAAAHEMNQPLTVLIGTLELFPTELTDAEAIRADLETMRRAATRLSTIVAKLGAITSYRTKPYAAGISILDIDRSVGETQ
jgi:DNA-binding response OmpR family regulator